MPHRIMSMTTMVSALPHLDVKYSLCRKSSTGDLEQFSEDQIMQAIMGEEWLVLDSPPPCQT